MTLTNSDKNWIKTALKDGLESQGKKFDKKLSIVRNELFDKIDDQEQKFEAKLTEFKSEFFKKIDPILKEVTTAREERPLIENRIEALEEIHPKGKHALV